jgi:hypothetical protein
MALAQPWTVNEARRRIDFHYEETSKSADIRSDYERLKFSVAKVLQPKIIVEIGVRAGVSALAFLAACPTATYIGYDNGRDAAAHGIDYRTATLAEFRRQGYTADIVVRDSQTMQRFPDCDLVHIDGDHCFHAVRHDFVLAWYSGAKWILCDDASDAAVAAGIFYALHYDLRRGTVPWAYFPVATGSILVRTDHRSEE